MFSLSPTSTLIGHGQVVASVSFANACCSDSGRGFAGLAPVFLRSGYGTDDALWLERTRDTLHPRESLVTGGAEGFPQATLVPRLRPAPRSACNSDSSATRAQGTWKAGWLGHKGAECASSCKNSRSTCRERWLKKCSLS